MAEKALAVITGASTGIGFELAKQFASHSFDLFIVSDTSKIDAAAAELQKQTGVIALQADLTRYAEVERTWDAIRALNRPIDALALNAGVGVWGDFVRDTALEDELALVQLNVMSALHLAKRAGAAMVAQGRGRILFTSSVAATMPGPLYAVYAASKAFIQSFAEALRNELSDTGVTVTALMPGATDTEFFSRAGMEDTKVGQCEKDDPAQVAKQGFEALMAGDDKVIGGAFLNKLTEIQARWKTDVAKARTQRKLLEPVLPTQH